MWSWIANTQHSIELSSSSIQNSNEENLRQKLRMQTTETTQQLASDVKPSELQFSVKDVAFKETGVDF